MSWLFGNGVQKSVLAQRLATLKKVVSPAILAEFTRFCMASSQFLFEVNIADVEKSTSIPRRVLIPVFLRAVKARVFNLVFRVRCQGCQGNIPAPALFDVHPEMICVVCGTHNHPELDGSVSAVFCLHPSIGKTKKSNQPFEDLPAIEVVNTQEFRDLFESQHPLPGEFVRVKSMCFLFTDIVGSTATYENLGDALAFRLVREHFEILFAAIGQHNGVAIKTIGDAVLASFLSSADGFACARDIQLRFKAFNMRPEIKEGCQIRIGLHEGPCVGVTLNNRLDFFGSTVNIAARVQSFAGPGQLCVTKKTVQKHLSRISREGVFTKKSFARLKGIARPVSVLLIN
ncbi:MAG: adenylate/guanylate cyclase domain-containing protein [Candidatus Woesearchaeota archaeon]|nr:adenylate/guanylate cyclase domain-containing protein [Candidatus Woesearchaeota archaeon]